ncbi:MAG: hypothetical protein N7Q72_00475, partial [Spiroplasma sp. Tabriz.8]|nr:hypothetical protein [Spiroplasma sp. Tabriz.8]
SMYICKYLVIALCIFYKYRVHMTIHVHIHTYIPRYIYIYIYLHIYIYIYMHTLCTRVQDSMLIKSQFNYVNVVMYILYRAQIEKTMRRQNIYTYINIYIYIYIYIYSHAM